jgi:hypothetical protein
MLTVNMMSRTSHAITDLLIFCILVTLGCIGFIHDDNYYLSNGNDSDYLNSSWLNQEIAAGGCMVATAYVLPSFPLPSLSISIGKYCADNDIVFCNSYW